MQIETKYNYEKNWTLTNEKDLLRMIEEEIGDSDAKGVLSYLKEATAGGKIIAIGSCKFRKNVTEK